MKGKISTAIVVIADPPRIAIKIAITTKVYGRLSANRTIHMNGWPRCGARQWKRPDSREVYQKVEIEPPGEYVPERSLALANQLRVNMASPFGLPYNRHQPNKPAATSRSLKIR